MLDCINKIIKTIKNDSEHRNIQPTLIYNEGWLMRLILLWFSEHRNVEYELITFKENAGWFSESLLSSPFLRNNKREGYTHADGVIGHFTIGNVGKGDLQLKENCSQFVVLEAKMFSPLSGKVKNAINYDQVTRTVVCMSHILFEFENNNNIASTNNLKLGCYVLLPKRRFKKNLDYIGKEKIVKQVDDRVQLCKQDRNYAELLMWRNYFSTFIDNIKVNLIPWEDIIKLIQDKDEQYGNQLDSYYKDCKEYNKAKIKKSEELKTAK